MCFQHCKFFPYKKYRKSLCRTGYPVKCIYCKLRFQGRNACKLPLLVINWTFFPRIQILIFLCEITQNDHKRLLYKFENDQKIFGCFGSCGYAPASVKYLQYTLFFLCCKGMMYWQNIWKLVPQMFPPLIKHQLQSINAKPNVFYIFYHSECMNLNSFFAPFTLCCKCIGSLASLYCKMAMFQRMGMKEGGGATPTSISIFDFFDTKTLWFEFGHDIFTGFKLQTL